MEGLKKVDDSYEDAENGASISHLIVKPKVPEEEPDFSTANWTLFDYTLLLLSAGGEVAYTIFMGAQGDNNIEAWFTQAHGHTPTLGQAKKIKTAAIILAGSDGLVSTIQGADVAPLRRAAVAKFKSAHAAGGWSLFNAALIFLAFAVGSSAASLGVIQKGGRAWYMIVLAVLALLAQYVLYFLGEGPVALNAGKQIGEFYRIENKWGELVRRHGDNKARAVWFAFGAFTGAAGRGTMFALLGITWAVELAMGFGPQFAMGAIFGFLGALMNLETNTLQAWERLLGQHTQIHRDTAEISKGPLYWILTALVVVLSVTFFANRMNGMAGLVMGETPENAIDVSLARRVLSIVLPLIAVKGYWDFARYMHDYMQSNVNKMMKTGAMKAVDKALACCLPCAFHLGVVAPEAKRLILEKAIEPAC